MSKSGFAAALSADLRVNTARSGLGGLVFGLLFNPGFSTLFWHRLAARLNAWPAGKIPARLIWHANVKASACHIHLDAELGPGIFLPHPTGIVVGAGVKVGGGSAIYQGVTLGLRRETEPGYPVIDEDVTIYTGAIILGPVHLGRGSCVAAQAFVNSSVPEAHLAYGAPARTRPLHSSMRRPAAEPSV